jgi:hypothetical protein
VRVLELASAKTCQDSCVEAQARELAIMREQLDRLQDLMARRDATRLHRPPAANASASGHGAGSRSRLVKGALDYIAAHHLEHVLTLKAISRHIGVTEKHLTHTFTEVAAQRMPVGSISGGSRVRAPACPSRNPAPTLGQSAR